MKILQVIHNYYPAHGGPQYTMKHLNEKMVQWYNDEIEVVTSNSMYGPEMPLYKKIEPPVENINGVMVHRFPFRRWHYKLLYFMNKVSAKLRGKGLPYSIMKRKHGLDAPLINKAMRTAKADVIVATTAGYNFCDYPVWRHTSKQPKPFILYGAIHLHMGEAALAPLIERVKACDCYIANTDFERETLINKYDIKPHKIVTIGTGVNVKDYECPIAAVQTFRKKYSIADDEILIGYIGRLSEGKGTALLLKAFEQLYTTNKKIKLLLAGSKTDYAEKIEQEIAMKKLPVILIQNFSDAEKAVMFQAMDIFVLASKGESFGVVFLEAWACKKPVIGANMGAIASLLSNGKDSYLFEHGNIEDLAEKINLLIADADKRVQFGSNGYNKVLHSYTWEIIVKKYREAYQLGIDNFYTSLK
ncbi:MAG: glycosyltransferase family 4 protein [Chitinophagaceae bacterium]|nr:glycosyltransferase family 4 protein [Chitinophagaceae bacterium]MCW5904888.1 glycosyltransferase family 4 protein [Chitinophagaceae bacterium]